MAIYHCVVIHCVLELGLLAAKLRYICETAKGMGKFFFEGGGSREMLNDRLYPINHVSKSQNLKISKSQNGFIENGQLLDYSFNIIIIYIYYNNIT